MIIEEKQEFKDLTKSSEPVFINDSKTHKTKGVYLPFHLYKNLVKDYETKILNDAMKTFDENPASEEFIELLNRVDE